MSFEEDGRWNGLIVCKSEGDGVFRQRNAAITLGDDAGVDDEYPEQPGIDDDSCCVGEELRHDLPSYRALEVRQARLTHEICVQRRHVAHLRSACIAGRVLAEAVRELERFVLELQETERRMEMLLN